MMASNNDNRKVSLVRTYLANLRDDPNASRKDTNTLQAVGRENQIPLKTLRAFRDGKDEALPALIVTTWARILGGDDGDITGVGSVSPIDRQWYNQTILARDITRIERYETYDTIDETRPEASSALDAWADIVVTGGVGDEGRRRSAFDPEVEGEGKRIRTILSGIADRINRFILPDDQKHMLVRDMAKYGDQFEQLGLGRTAAGDIGITQLVNMPIQTMWVKTDKTGRQDPHSAYVQIPPGQAEPATTWPAWKMVQFSNRKSRADLYGRSIFESCLRSYIQIEAMEAAMVIRRLERAPLRMLHTIDVGHLASEAEIQKAKEDYRRKNRKIRTVDGNKNFQMQRISMPADEDYIVAKRDKDSPANISPLEGDGNIGVITDFEHFFNKWLSGLGPPKAHLGYEADTMRSVVTDLHIVFARKGRRMQMQFIRGLSHLYYVELILMGIDPRQVRFGIIPPALGTRDELVRAQVMVAHASTVRFLAQAFASTGKVPSIPWFMKYMMGLDDETVDGLELTDVIEPTTGTGITAGPSGSPPNRQEALEMARAAFTNPEIVAEVNKARFLLNERAIGLRKPQMMGLDWPLLENPFGHHFDDVVRSLGVKELRTVIE